MDTIAKDLLLNTLAYDIYGGLLTKKQKEIYCMYFFEDFSLAEIGQQFGISRQAVNFSIKQSQKSLAAYEEELGLIKRHEKASLCFKDLQAAFDGQNYNECSKLLLALSEVI